MTPNYRMKKMNRFQKMSRIQPQIQAQALLEDNESKMLATNFGQMTTSQLQQLAARSRKMKDNEIFNIVENYLKQRQAEQDHARSLLSSFGSVVANQRGLK